jgi:signal transduction histidine kinase
MGGDKRKQLTQYVMSILMVAAALVLSHFLWPYADRTTATLFLAAIMLSAYYWGLGPGILATIISVGLIDYYFVPPFYRFELNLSTFLRAGMFTTLATLVSWLNDSRRQLMVNLRERDQEREGLIAQINAFNVQLTEDINDKTRKLNSANSELLVAQQRLAHAEKMEIVGQLAASLAHEIGTPLNAIAGHMQLLGRSHPGDSDTQRRIQIINKQLDFIVSIVKSLLERTHKRAPVICPIDLNSLLKDLFLLVAPMLEQHSVLYALMPDYDLPLVAADQDKLQQVLLNLINNSLDAMPDGGKITIATSYNRNMSRAVVEFFDSGIGIQTEMIEQIFEPMWTTKSTGSGFGLSIVREIISEHGGEIEPVQVPGRGACFVFSLPLYATESDFVDTEVAISAVQN